jgi:hypothetical protein
MSGYKHKFRKVLVEECETITVQKPLAFHSLGINMGTVRSGRGGHRNCIFCRRCGRSMFKLYRPPGATEFACRACHRLTYRSVRQHDARLDGLLKLPDSSLLAFIEQTSSKRWKLLAIKAGYIRLGLLPK